MINRMEDRDNRLLTIPNPVMFLTLVTLLKSPSKFALYIKYIFLFTWLCNLCVFPTLMKLVEVMSNVYILSREIPDVISHVREYFPCISHRNQRRLRACLHGVRLTLLGGSPFYKGPKIAPLYMQSLIPRAIAIIQFGAEGHNCTVAQYKTTKIIFWYLF